MFTLLGLLVFVIAAGGLVWLVEAQMWREPGKPAAARPRLLAGSRPPGGSKLACRPRCLLHRNRWAIWLPIPLPFLARRLAVLIVIKF
jgi:hypothetical protein